MKLYCDNCGEDAKRNGGRLYAIRSLDTDISSANKGESGVMCKPCFDQYKVEIWASHGKWTHANGDEIDESQVPVGERFEKR